MVFDTNLASALQKVRLQIPDVFEEFERCRVTFVQDQIISLFRPTCAARLKERLRQVQNPTSPHGLTRIKQVLRHELGLVNEQARSLPSADGTSSAAPPPTSADLASSNQRQQSTASTPSSSLLASSATAAKAKPAEPMPEIPPTPADWQDLPPQKSWLPKELEGSLGSLFGDFEYSDPIVDCANSLAGWRVLAGTRRGRLHAHHGTFREDAFAHGGDSDQGRFWIFCVCDGAGSSRLSRVGSEVTSRRLVRELSRTFRETSSTWAALPIEGLKDVLEKTIVATVRDTTAFLGELAQRAKVEPKDFRCTLLLTVLYRQNETELACLSQVGDGFLAGLNRQGIAKRYGTADASGAFSGEVNCFIPDDGSAEKAKPFGIIPSTENLEALLLCTDGIEDPFYPVEANAELLFQQFTRETPTATPVAGIGWPENPGGAIACADRTLACQRLARWLAFEKKGENDDRTVMLIHRDPASGSAGSPKPSDA